MSGLCSLPWCRKPTSNRKKSRKFPPDRPRAEVRFLESLPRIWRERYAEDDKTPTQLAWLDALDAGAWFSIPPETLCTGFILCDLHFDSKGNVKRRYEMPTYNPSSIKMEPNMSEGSEEDGEPENDNAEDSCDSDYSPTKTSGKRKGPKIKEVRVNIVRVKNTSKNAQSHKPGTSSQNEPKRTSGRRKIARLHSDTECEEDDINNGDEININEPDEATSSGTTNLDSIDPDTLSKLTSDAIQKSSVKINNQGGKRQSVTLMQKMEVIRMLDKGMKQAHIRKKLNMRRSTVWHIVQSRDKIEEAYRAGAPLRKRIVRRGAFADINDAVYQWYEKVRTQNLYVNARVLLTMAENIANELGRTDFAASPNWLTRFKERYNIRFTATSAKPKSKLKVKPKKERSEDNGEAGLEEASNEENDYDKDNKNNEKKITHEDENIWLKNDWLKNIWMESRVKHDKSQELYAERDIFFVEELGILYRVTPKQAWQFKSGKNVDSTQEFSITDERLTILLCANADGSEKQRLLVIGKTQSGMPTNLPADYVTTTDPSNWITKSIFARWIKCWDSALQRDSRKIILISNQSPIHTYSYNLSNVKIVNIPSRVLTSVHPVNFGISTNFKIRYRRLLLERLINGGGCRPISCLDAIFMFSTAWNELSPNLIRTAFLKAGFFQSSDIPKITEDEFDCSDLLSKAAELDLAVPSSKYSFSEYVEIDNSLCAVECTIIGNAENAEEDDILNDGVADNREYVPVECNLTAADAQKALENMRLFAMSRQSCPQEVHNALSTLESFLLEHKN